ncbi:Peptide-N4-(N-acetyl-beta-glucosaminyl)asparagine amidase A [Heracleum sosnowskyi]|uniref:Peptide-N4-(N-acetyl-beta-glucosaminyl)asparagine amidase A n=1 Tax=Heracleum sosnowskyi TaxID=360622 RepID=A0AAD8LYC5_9APIA|nr:Peptide-N4-(N-acetyl-beta-glucosaminyl)asparagine amidase A [Heracleum sosnowskyi]
MSYFHFSLFFSLLFTLPLHLNSNPTFEPHLHHTPTTPTPFFELTRPLPIHAPPQCTHLALSHNFSNTINKPPISIPYSPPPNCTQSNHVFLEFNVSSKGDQYDRIAAVWLNGVEILRTSTAEPNEEGIYWSVRKDVSRYLSVVSISNATLTVMLENIVNDVFTGVYNVNVSFLYYDSVDVGRTNNVRINRKLGVLEGRDIVEFNKRKRSYNVYEKAADLIIPVSGDEEKGFWFRIESESDVHYKEVVVPLNCYRAVVEVYVSFHGDDEFWYSNPPDEYIRKNGLVTGRGHGSYREVFVSIDGSFVGSVVPFPVIFTGGINPLFWEPIVGIGAFDLPSYDIDLTPFLGMLLDGKPHRIGLGVGDSISYWLVDANLHLWIDHGVDQVQAKVLDYLYPTLTIERKSVFNLLDGNFKVEVKRKSQFVGWVNSTLGNLTTHVSQEFKFKNSIKFTNNGSDKVVEQKVKTTTEVEVKSDQDVLISHGTVKREYPLNIKITNITGSGNDTYIMVTSIVHELNEKSGLKEKNLNGGFSSNLQNKQNSSGWMEVKDHSVLSGEAATDQFYTYKDEFGCYSRISKTAGGRLVSDNSSFSCASSY